MNAIANRIREHCCSSTHAALYKELTGQEHPQLAKRGFATLPSEEAGGNSDSEGEREEWELKTNPRVLYHARSADEIACAIAEAEFKYQASGQDGGQVDDKSFNNDVESNDGSSVTVTGEKQVDPFGNKPEKSKWIDITWDYFKDTGRISESNNSIWECLFCDYEAVRNITHFRRHLFKLCPGCPDGIRERIKAQEKKVALSGKKRKWRYENKSRVSHYMSGKSDEEEDSQADDDLETDVQANNEAVQILTKLLAEGGNDALPSNYGSTCKSGSGRKEKSVENYTDADLDRELKELQVKKMRAEISKLNEETEKERINKKHIEVKIEESKSRCKLIGKLEDNLDKVISVASLMVGSESLRSTVISAFRDINSAINLNRHQQQPSSGASSSNSILQEAYHDTINGPVGSQMLHHQLPLSPRHPLPRSSQHLHPRFT